MFPHMLEHADDNSSDDEDMLYIFYYVTEILNVWPKFTADFKKCESIS